jgi:competence protein ComEC
MLNLRELPFLRILLAFAAGIPLCVFINAKIDWLPALQVLLFGALLLLQNQKGWYRYRWLFGAVFSSLLMTWGYSVTFHHNELNRPTHFSKWNLTPGGYFIGEVREAPVKKEDWIKLELQTLSTGTAADSLGNCSGAILLYVARDSAAESLAYGDLLVFSGKPSLVEPPKNPDAFDYSRYLHFQNIHYQAFVRNGEWAILERDRGNPFYGTALQYRDRFIQVMRKYLPGEREFSVGAALILGYRDEVPDEVLTAYSETGAMHLLAVSGMHVGFIFMILQFLLGKVKWYSLAWRIAKVGISLACIWSFALVTGASPSVLRATVMFSFFIVGKALRRNNNIYNTLASSAFCLLLYDPYLLFSVSFQLSYLALWGIVYFEPKLTRLWVIENKAGHYFWQLNNVSIGAQLMTMPLTLFYFNQFPVYFWASSLILVPVSGIILGGGMLLFSLESASPFLAGWLGKALHGFIWFSNEVIFLIQKLPLAVIDGIWINYWLSALLMLALLCSMAAVAFKKFRWLIAGLAFLVVVSLNFSFTGYRQHQRRQLVIYHVYKHSLLDFFDGRHAYSLADETLEEKPERFAAEGHRVAMGVKMREQIHFEDSTAHVFDRLFVQNGFVQFHHTKLAVLSAPIKIQSGERLKIDYLVLRNSPAADIADFAKSLDFQQVIFDASNKKWKVDKWKAECDSLQIRYFDVAQAGAFVLDL